MIKEHIKPFEAEKIRTKLQGFDMQAFREGLESAICVCDAALNVELTDSKSVAKHNRIIGQRQALSFLLTEFF